MGLHATPVVATKVFWSLVLTAGGQWLGLGGLWLKWTGTEGLELDGSFLAGIRN